VLTGAMTALRSAHVATILDLGLSTVSLGGATSLVPTAIRRCEIARERTPNRTLVLGTKLSACGTT
jgi:hypothetical protein